MAQQPNIEVDRSRAPLPTPEPGPARRGGPARPGVIESPADTEWGGSYGTPGPDTGWAIRLIGLAEFDRTHRGRETESLLAALVAARASRAGRAPIPEDVEVGLIMLGLRDGLPAELAERRERWLDAATHERPRGATALREIEPTLLAQKPEQLLAAF